MYQIPCEPCKELYNGQTGKDLESKITNSVRTKQKSKVLFNYGCPKTGENACHISIDERNITKFRGNKHGVSCSLNISSNVIKLGLFIANKIVSCVILVIWRVPSSDLSQATFPWVTTLPRSGRGCFSSRSKRRLVPLGRKGPRRSPSPEHLVYHTTVSWSVLYMCKQ